MVTQETTSKKFPLRIYDPLAKPQFTKSHIREVRVKQVEKLINNFGEKTDNATYFTLTSMLKSIQAEVKKVSWMEQLMDLFCSNPNGNINDIINLMRALTDN